MRERFSVKTEWESPNRDSVENSHCFGRVRIDVGERIATRAENEFSGSVEESVYVSAYPLALWLAGSWWRICWEPSLSEPRPPGAITSWRTSHEMPAAGAGFVWPQLVFDGDGESVEIASFAMARTPGQPLRYLESFRQTLDLGSFSSGIDSFVSRVLSRLDSYQINKTTLHELWNEIVEERTDAKKAEIRILEARLGFDAGEAPDFVIESFLGFREAAGKSALLEVASTAAYDPKNRLQQIADCASSPEIVGSLTDKKLLSGHEVIAAEHGFPWQRGRTLAKFVRQTLGIGSAALKDSTLCDVLGLPTKVISRAADAMARRVALAVRSPTSDSIGFTFRNRGNFRANRRFELARFLSEIISAPTDDHWLMLADTKTARQKLQRAFGAELLCPIEPLRAFLDDDFSNESVEAAGEHFGASPLLIKSHLANYGLITPDAVIV